MAQNSTPNANNSNEENNTKKDDKSLDTVLLQRQYIENKLKKDPDAFDVNQPDFS